MRAHAAGEDIRAVVVSSAVSKIFTAGLDRQFVLSDPRNYIHLCTVKSAAGLAFVASDTAHDRARASLALRNTILEFQNAIGTPDRCPFPVIAAVHGPVVGLGVDIIAACDVRYAASNTTFSIKVSNRPV